MSSLSGTTIVIIRGTSGVGLETARQAHAAGAKLILTGRDQGRLRAARDELGAARLLGDDLERRREQLHATLPIRQVVGPADVAALALQLMTNTALTGATYDADGGQQLIP